ncbi:MAG: hypothetical protein WBG43_07110 [Marinifilaceae bacterium]
MNIFNKLIKKQLTFLDKEKKKNNGFVNLNPFLSNGLETINEFIIARYGSEEEAKNRLEDFIIDGVFSDISFKALFKDMYLDRLFFVFKPLLNAKGIISLIRNIEKIKQRAESLTESMAEEERVTFLSVLDKYMECLNRSSLGIIQTNKMDLKGIEDLLGIKLNFSKKEIAADFFVSRETFNAWLHVFYKDTYKDVRKISLEEYIDIIAKFTTEDPSELKSDKYVSRIMNGVVLKKIDLAEIDGCDPKTLQNNLKHKFPIYKEMDKFPYSMAKEFLDHIGTDIDDRNLCN